MAQDDAIIALSGMPVEDITIGAVRAGEISPDDVRIHPRTLERQARVAEMHGNPQLAANFRRAAELTALPDVRLLAVYEALRPGRSSHAELIAIAEEFENAGASATAELIREAAEAYAERGIAR